MRMKMLAPLLALLASVNAASALTLTVSDAACRSVAAHQPSADVEYRPGVDVHGKPVAPADLNGGFAFNPLDELIVDITADMAGRLTGSYPQPQPAGSETRRRQPRPGATQPSPPPPYAGYGSVGSIVIEGGRLLFNGRPLQDPFEEELAVLCAMARRGR